jgi:DNA polymerase I
LVGDTSDNIPGVPGIGEKTATTLVSAYESLEGIYQALQEDPLAHPDIKPKVRENLTTYRDQAFLSRDLSRIVTDIPLDFDLKATTIHDFDRKKAEALFAELEFSSLIRRLNDFGGVAHHEESVAKETPAKPERTWEGKTYHLVGTEAEFDAFLERLRQRDTFAFDTETRDLDCIAKNLIGLSFAWSDHEGYYVAFEHADGPTIDRDRALAALKPIFEDDKVGKVAHNLKYDYEVLLCYGVETKGLAFDTLLGSYLLNPGARTLKLDNLAFQELGYQMQPITELIGTGRKQKSLADISSEVVAKYAAEDAEVTWQLYGKLEQNLRDVGLEKVLHEIDLPLVPVIGAMEQRGVKLDGKYLEAMGRRFQKEIDTLEADIRRHAGHDFNVNSPSQLATVLFEELELGKGVTKRGGKHKSTAADQLEKYKDAHPIIPLILRYRELSKLKSTYIDALPGLVREDTGRLHTSYSQTVAATGRLSSSDPNLQNIPIRTEQGREIRKAFVTEKGYVLLAADICRMTRSSRRPSGTGWTSTPRRRRKSRASRSKT